MKQTEHAFAVVACNVRASIESLEERRLFSVPSGFLQEQLAGGMTSPTAMALAPDGRIFITEQQGAVRIVKNNQLLSTPFTHVTTDSSGESGLLGIVLDPHFEQNGYVYIYYRSKTPFPHNTITRFTASGDVAAANSARTIFDQPRLGTAHQHEGGAMRFGPDGKLYIGVGDNAQFEVAQQLTNTFGKVLRINADGSIPSDNPFYSRTTGANRAIWAIGLRNPFSMDFQPGTGKLYVNDIGDVGDNAWEEINVGRAGGNYGWPAVQGMLDSSETAPANYSNPIYTYNHGVGNANGSCIAAGVFYNPPAGAAHPFPAKYTGQYFFLDLNHFVHVLSADGKQVSPFATAFYSAVSMEMAPDGSLLYLQRGRDGHPSGIFRMRYTASAVAPPSILAPPASRTVNPGQSVTFKVDATGAGTLTYQWLRNGHPISGATGASYTLSSPTLSDNGASFTVSVSNAGGSTLSSAAKLTVTTNHAPVPTIDLPASTLKFVAGTAISFHGSATDAEDGTLGATKLTLSISYFTGIEERPFVEPFSGKAGGTFTPPRTAVYLGTDVKYRIYLTATDSGGRSTTVYRDVLPVVGQINVASNIAGLTIHLDGHPRVTPSGEASVAGLTHELSAAKSQVLNGVTYDFVSWSDGGAATHDIFAPSTSKTYTAIYKARPA